MSPETWALACRELAAGDAALAGLIERYADTRLRSRGEPYQTLLRAIVGQQISTQAADAIWARLEALLDTSSPQAMGQADPQALRTAGLSLRKVEYARDLALHFVDGRIDPAAFDALDDEAIIAELTAVRGIGRWTAEMFLIFNLLRGDVWPVDDIGLQKAVALHYLDGERPAPAALRRFGERWRPWRTVACWYLWRSLDPQEVLY
nr:DNA-3-methyladenine glycosylase 2 family protein [Chromobacterium sp. ASV5]